jgi:hypothetical protein
LIAQRIRNRVIDLYAQSMELAPAGRAVMSYIISRYAMGIMPLCRKCSRDCPQALAPGVSQFFCADFHGK